MADFLQRTSPDHAYPDTVTVLDPVTFQLIQVPRKPLAWDEDLYIPRKSLTFVPMCHLRMGHPSTCECGSSGWNKANSIVGDLRTVRQPHTKLKLTREVEVPMRKNRSDAARSAGLFLTVASLPVSVAGAHFYPSPPWWVVAGAIVGLATAAWLFYCWRVRR